MLVPEVGANNEPPPVCPPVVFREGVDVSWAKAAKVQIRRAAQTWIRLNIMGNGLEQQESKYSRFP